MTVNDIIEADLFELVCSGDSARSVEGIFCCDLLSVAMGKGKENFAWVTVMGNINTLAVLHLTDMSCVILAEGAVLDEEALKKAEQINITVFKTPRPIFESALEIQKLIDKN